MSDKQARLEAMLARDRRANPIRYYQPRPKSLPFHACNKAVRFAAGGKRSSKSYTTVAEAVAAMTGIEPLGCPGLLGKYHPPPFHVRHWCPDLNRAGKKVLLPIYHELIPPRMLDQKRGQNGFNKEDNTLYLTTGSWMQLMSYEMDAIKGESAKLDMVPFDEPPRESLYESQYARVVDSGGYITGAMTLDERRASYPIQWIDERIRRGGDGDHVAWFQFSTRENVEAIARELGGQRGQQVLQRFQEWERSISNEERAVCIEGLGGWLSGLVYKEFDQETHASYDLATPEQLVARAKAGQGALWCGFDYGMRDPTAVLWAYINFEPSEPLKLAERDYILYREYCVPNRFVQQHIPVLARLSHGEPIRGWFGGWDMWNQQPQGGLTIAGLYIKAGFRMFRAEREKDVGKEAVHRLLAVRAQGDITWPQLRACKGTCRQWINQMLGYCWKPVNERTGMAGDKTMDVNDHLPDALRYLAVSRPEKKGRLAPGQGRTPAPVGRDMVTGMPVSMLAELARTL